MTRTDAALAALGAGLFEGSRVVVRRARVSRLEETVFRLANDADDRLRLPVRSVMQFGTFGSVPVVAGLLIARGARRSAAEVAVGGTAAWLTAKVAKPLGGRPRPELLLARVTIRERIAGDLGWVSGHGAVSTAIAVTLWPRAAPAVRRLLVLAVGVTAFGRMYVGAHLPLDLAGGAGLGLMIVAIVRAVERRPLLDRCRVDGRSALGR